ncbi:hypothetical protein ACFV0R_06780 [Streptomyces sp. NPDC059578]|uniref:hypothetical protein n=1 Tax=unclassified Streptomyces TaxID=2593676 RepID=UPI003651F593
MRAIRLASATALAGTALIASALALAAPIATAEDRGTEEEQGSGHSRFDVSAAPTTIAAGGQVTLRSAGCSGETRVTSGVFDTVRLRSGDRSRSVTVDWDARAGAEYAVTFSCEEGASRTLHLTVAGSRSEGDHHSGTDLEERRGVRAGIGGTVAGFDLGEIGLGAALIGGAIGSAWYVTRRRTDENAS